MKKFIKYREFTIECEELFEGAQNNEDENIYLDLSCNYSQNKLTYSCHSSRTSNECLFPRFTAKSVSPKKNKENLNLKKSKNSEISGNNLCKLKIDSGKRLISEMKSSFSSNKIADFTNSLSLNKTSKYMKKFSADLYLYPVDNKNDDSSKLINYCYKLKKPNDEIITEISDDDTITNKDNTKKLLFLHRIKNNHKNVPNKKLKKTINKKKSDYKNNHNNDDKPLRKMTRKKTTNFTNQMKLYFDNVEKSNPKEKIKIQFIGKKTSNIEVKKIDAFHWKNISQLHHHNSKSSEKKLKGKKLEKARKSFCTQEINEKAEHKKTPNLLTYFKAIDNPITLKHIEKKEKKEKNDVSIAINNVSDIQFQRKHSNSSKTLSKKNDKLQQNGISIFGKKSAKNYLNKRNESLKIESTKNEKKNINISNNNCNKKIIRRNFSIDNKRNLKNIS